MRTVECFHDYRFVHINSILNVAFREVNDFYAAVMFAISKLYIFDE